MKNKPLVSVVIPFYDHVEWLSEAVDSVLAQAYSQYEIIIVNDGSKEDMDTFLDLYKEKIVYIYKENGGPATARNLGIDNASGEYIAFLDSDDLWHCDKLEKQVAFMETNNYVWSHTSYEKFGGKYDQIKLVNSFQDNVYPQILYSCPIATPCVIVKSEIFKTNENLRFNTRMRYGQDYYLWIYLSINYSLGVLPEVLSQVRLRGSNAAVRASVQVKARAQIWKCLNNDSDKFIQGKKIYQSVKGAYCMCVAGESLLNYVEKKGWKKKFIEDLARILYLAPWIVFKVNSRRLS